MIVISGLEPKQYSITPEGIAELQQQLKDLRQQRKGLAEEMHDASAQSTEMGALEDSTLSLDQNKATELDGQIALLERIIGLAQIIPPPESKKEVSLGSRVTIRRNDKEQMFMLVGPVEADPLEGKVSNESPFGQSLMGRKVGDSIEMTAPNNQRSSATIIGIE
ncbi:MAG TPA: GreA/GreB family elongation factor [Candidatus Saccharimonadales bacterium]|nr:GreA/GreB family elongation factor [Candidatus Saccharimonadales bacterium]